MFDKRASRAALLATTALAAFTAISAPAGAAHWPLFGGDAGRSGNQPAEKAALPAQLVYEKTAMTDQKVMTSVLTSAGMPDTQRVIYGTADGSIHQRVLATGAAVGPEAGVKVGAVGAFGTSPGSVSFTETSTAAGLGQVFAAYNDVIAVAPTINLAQVDETDGALVKDMALTPATVGFTMNSSALLTPAPMATDRLLFFVAKNAANVEALFKVSITNAQMKTAVISSATSTGPMGAPADINATPTASPTLVYLNDAMGKVTPYVAVGTLDGRVLTFNTLTLAAGPTIMGLGGAVSTPSVPVTAAGMTPGSMGADAPKAPFIYATASTATDTLVHRLTQDANAMTLTKVTSPMLPGLAGTAVATNQVATATGASDGVVLVTTGKNLYSLSTTDLTVKAKFDGGDSLVPNSTGFLRNAALVSGNIAFVTRDNGQLLTLDATTMAAMSGVPAAPGNAGSMVGFGQPSLSRQFLQFGSDKGLFVYRLGAPQVAAAGTTAGAPAPATAPPAAPAPSAPAAAPAAPRSQQLPVTGTNPFIAIAGLGLAAAALTARRMSRASS